MSETGWWFGKNFGRASPAERQAAREAEERKQDDDRKSKLKDIENAAKDAQQERVGITATKKYFFPMDLEQGADQGLPFIRFGIEQNKGNAKVAVYLYQPPGLSVSDGVNYTGFDMGTLRGGLDVAKALVTGQPTNANMADVFAAGLIGKDKFVTGGGTIDKITSNAALTAGVATNPYTRTAYESTAIRGFTFNFKMVASNEKESKQIKAIERTFRKFLYPKRAGSIALVYPPLFNISFYSKGRINSYMPTIHPSYLTSLETTFNETATAMHEGTGAPVEVNIALTFQEERVLIRQDLYGTDDAIEENESGIYYKSDTSETKLGGAEIGDA